jgi:acyl transferase domain-containing protein/acyl carrier protein
MSTVKPIAIVGIGCRFPGADGPRAFWRLLADGVDAISEVPSDRWSLDDVYDDDPAAPGKMNTRFGGFLGNVDRFDAAFFGISPREAAHVDPQQRLLLEVAWEALEDAGAPADRLAGQSVGVFVGMSTYDYGGRQLARFDEIRDGYSSTGSALSIGANRISYLFDFHGPSMVIDTACSSSLVAVHYACQSLMRGESRIALAGGVNVILSPAVTIGFSKLQAMAPDGRCKAFDARADGFVRGEGAGIVVLKPLEAALSDHDRIYAVIRGGAVNQDGRTNGLTAPNGLSQEALLREAFSSAGVRPSEIQYVEAHGTGTALGDPIELNALGAVLAAGRSRDARCAVGSAKTNLGHLEAAAGVAGLIKLALALEHRQLPPSLHFNKPNPYIRFDVLPLRVVTGLEPWPEDSGPARGGVSSFGFGGTNAHLVLEESPSRVPTQQREDEACVLPVSARSEHALADLARAYAEKLADDANELNLVELCTTAAVRRSHHDFRLAAVASSRGEMASALAAFAKGEHPREVEAGRRIASRRRKIAFVFPGHGSQWLGMGRALMKREPLFAEAIERCSGAISECVGWSLAAELEAPPEKSRLDDIDVVQPAMFAIQVALGELWRSWGIKPDAVVGHSMGEVTAAHIAGALSLGDAARVVCHRGRLAARAGGRGAMAMVELSFGRASEILAGYEDRLAVAACNSPTSTVLSGDSEALEKVLADLERDGVFWRRVNIGYASHSPQMDPLRADLMSVLAGLAPRRTKVPLYSTVTGTIASGPDLGPAHWARNLREPVLFAGVIERLLDDGIEVFLEVSSHPILLAAIRQCLSHLHRDGVTLGSLRRDEPERRSMMSTLARLYAIGKPVDWSRLYSTGVECLSLPTYPWQRERFWFDDGGADKPAPDLRGRVKAKNPLIGEHVRPESSGPAIHVWQREIGLNVFPFLKDYRVRGESVLSGSACLEMALEAGNEALGEGSLFTLEHLRFEKTPVLAEREALRLQVILTRQLPVRFKWDVYGGIPATAVDGAPQLARYAHGEIHVSVSDEPHSQTASESLAAVRERCSSERSGADHYRLMADLHFDYGPSFQGIEAVWTGDREAVARLRPAPSDARRYQLHPALLDSALQILVGALSAEAHQTLLPVSVDRFRLWRQDAGSGALWAHAVWRNEGPRAVGDVRLLTESGEQLAQAIGIALEPLDGSTARENECFYTRGWEKRAATPAAPDEKREGAFLIFADSTGTGISVAERISARGGTPVLVVPGTVFQVPDNLTECRSCRIDPARGEDYSRLLEELTRRGVAIDSVVHLWGLDTGEGVNEASDTGVGSSLLLAQALVRSGIDSPPRLWLVTRAAQHVVEDDDVSPFRALQWGLARTIAREHPKLLCTAIDLDQAEREIEAAALVDELFGRHRDEQVAFRHRERFVARAIALSRHALVRRKGTLSTGEAARPFRAGLTETGNLSSLVLRQTVRRRPAPDEVEIEVLAAGLNFRDILAALGLMPDDGGLVLGHECAGKIVAVGDDVTEWKTGDEVVALARPALSSFVRTSASLVAAKPARLDFEEAATLPVAFLTAHYAVNHLGRLQRGERVLVHSATGAVGLACIRMAELAGAEIYATAGSEEKRRFLENLGVRRAMDSRSLGFAGEVMEASRGEGVDVVVNSLAGEALARGLEILRPGGRFIELGKRDLLEGGQIPLRWLEDSRSFFLVDLGRLAEKRPEVCGWLLREAIRFFEEQHFAPVPRRVFPAGEMADAFHLMARSRHIGKVVISMAQGGITPEPPADASDCIRDDSTYVIAGDFGETALFVGRWLVEKGARHLVFAGRSEPPAEAREAIDTMEHAGGRVVLDRIDLADSGAVTDAFVRWARDLRPVRGIVFTAPITDDGSPLERNGFRGVVTPAVDAAWNLHRASLECALDSFLLLSPEGSMPGLPGDSHDAANEFLDSLAHYRKAQALPAASITWERNLSPEQRAEALGHILLADVPQVSVTRASQSDSSEMPPFSRLEGGVTDLPDTPEPVLARFLAASPEERIGILEEHLRQHVASVLGIAAHRIDYDQPLVTMGIDSLMAVELKNRVEKEIGVAIPLLHLIKGPSLSELARSLASLMTGEALSLPGNGQTVSTLDEGSGGSRLLSVLSFTDSPRQSTGADRDTR